MVVRLGGLAPARPIIHKLIPRTKYSGTVFCHGYMHVQVCLDDVIDLIVDDIIMLLY